MVKRVKEKITSIDSLKKGMVKSLINICTIPAIGPISGGDGEGEKGNYLLNMISDFGFDNVSIFNASDSRVSSGYRPNIVTKVSAKGESKRTLWIVVHIDTVPPGDLTLWKSNPYKPTVTKGNIYGRGVEDNGQSIISSLFALKRINDGNISLKNDIGIALVSDEEEGSEKGVIYLLKKNIFKPNDIIIVPDAGYPEGTFINIGEKSRLTLEIEIIGKQNHASRPFKGINSYSIASIFLSKLLQELYGKYSKRDDTFDPPVSTFEPTRVIGNDASTNTIPGRHVFYMDCRILPEYNLSDVLKTINNTKEVNSYNNNYLLSNGSIPKININILRKEPAQQPTDFNSEVVQIISKSILKTRRKKSKPIIMGSGTCASFFRKNKYEVAAWETIEQTAHQPNEYIKIRNLVNDYLTFYSIFKYWGDTD